MKKYTKKFTHGGGIWKTSPKQSPFYCLFAREGEYPSILRQVILKFLGASKQIASEEWWAESRNFGEGCTSDF